MKEKKKNIFLKKSTTHLDTQKNTFNKHGKRKIIEGKKGAMCYI